MKLTEEQKCLIEHIQTEITPIYRKYRGRPEMWHEALRWFINAPIKPDKHLPAQMILPLSCFQTKE